MLRSIHEAQRNKRVRGLRLADSVFMTQAQDLSKSNPISKLRDDCDFCSFRATAFEFGLLKAMVGTRQMLNLVWSKEKGIKEAVVDAYKRLYIPTEGNER